MTSMAPGDLKRISIEEANQGLQKTLEGFLKSVPPSILPYTGHLSGSFGKNLRGRALLLSAMGDDHLLDPSAIDLAVAIEGFHLATLVHDDIIDDAKTRRGQPSLQAKFGKKTAVLCGDYLLARSLELGAEVMKKFDQEDSKKNRDFSMPYYASLVCLGEIRQHTNNFNLDLSARRYLSIIRGKTAALFEAAFAGGELFIQEDERISPENTHAYKKLGRYMGMIFQMMDDLIDIELEEEEAKKPILSDFLSGVITLPLILAMEENPSIKAEIRHQMDSARLDPLKIQSLTQEAGGNQKTREVARAYYKMALAELDSLNLVPYKHNLLKNLLDRAMGND